MTLRQLNQTQGMPSQQEYPQEAFDWYDEYAAGDIDRRTFLSRLAPQSLRDLLFCDRWRG